MSKAKKTKSNQLINTFNEPLNVLITRPEFKGQALSNSLNNIGICAQHWTLFTYQESTSERLNKQCEYLLTLSDKSTLIFVSVAAVEYANRIIPSHLWCYRQVLAVGDATQAKLNDFGLVSVAPERQNSEGLLQIKELETVSGDNIVIVRGDGGRELIFDTLNQRGAYVSYAQSYQRVWLKPSSNEIINWYNQRVNCIVVTSVAILEFMLDLVLSGNDLSTKEHWLKSCFWVVASERIAKQAKTLGLNNVINAQSADNQRLLNVIIELEQNDD